MPNPVTEFSLRRQRLASLFPKWKVDAFLVTALPNIRYLSGFTGSNAALLITKSRALLFTDPRYQTQAPQESDCDIRIAKGALLPTVLGTFHRFGIRNLGFELTRLSFDGYSLLEREAKKVRLKPIASAVEKLRMVKSSSEIETIRASVLLNSKALDQALRRFKPGMAEVELAAEIEYRMRLLGADKPSFETIVASGPRSALPHAHPTAEAIQSNQLLLIDMGAYLAGYASDMTRTFGVGNLSRRAKRMYQAVLESQLAAIDAVREGVTADKVDRAARSVLRHNSFDQYFIHSTGHGLGLEIHETPRIGKGDGTVLESGMAITIEPGVYIEGLGGVRIEDTVVVTKNGCEILTPAKKELIAL